MLAKHASQDGCKVILTGDSADELFSGYLHHHKYWIENYIENKMKMRKKLYHGILKLDTVATDGMICY